MEERAFRPASGALSFICRARERSGGSAKRQRQIPKGNTTLESHDSKIRRNVGHPALRHEPRDNNCREYPVITKPEQHETDRAGQRLLREVLEPLAWVVNDVQEDYGIDYNVQVFDGGLPPERGFIFS